MTRTPYKSFRIKRNGPPLVIKHMVFGGTRYRYDCGVTVDWHSATGEYLVMVDVPWNPKKRLRQLPVRSAGELLDGVPHSCRELGRAYSLDEAEQIAERAVRGSARRRRPR